MAEKEQKQYWTMKIRPKEKLWHIDLGEIWRYRDLIDLFVRRNILVQYKQTILGPLWFVIQPILTVIMNMVVFGGIASMSTDGVPQAVFYMAGNVCWFYFSDCLNQTSTTFTANQKMFGKVYFPRLVVPISTVLSNLLRFGIQLGLFVAPVYLFLLPRCNHLSPTGPSALIPVFVVMLAGLGSWLRHPDLIDDHQVPRPDHPLHLHCAAVDVCHPYRLSPEHGGRRSPAYAHHGQPHDFHHRGLQICYPRTGLLLVARPGLQLRLHVRAARSSV